MARTTTTPRDPEDYRWVLDAYGDPRIEAHYLTIFRSLDPSLSEGEFVEALTEKLNERWDKIMDLEEQNIMYNTRQINSGRMVPGAGNYYLWMQRPGEAEPYWLSGDAMASHTTEDLKTAVEYEGLRPWAPEEVPSLVSDEEVPVDSKLYDESYNYVGTIQEVFPEIVPSNPDKYWLLDTFDEKKAYTDLTKDELISKIKESLPVLRDEDEEYVLEPHWDVMGSDADTVRWGHMGKGNENGGRTESWGEVYPLLYSIKNSKISSGRKPKESFFVVLEMNDHFQQKFLKEDGKWTNDDAEEALIKRFYTVSDAQNAANSATPDSGFNRVTVAATEAPVKSSKEKTMKKSIKSAKRAGELMISDYGEWEATWQPATGDEVPIDNEGVTINGHTVYFTIDDDGEYFVTVDDKQFDVGGNMTLEIDMDGLAAADEAINSSKEKNMGKKLTITSKYWPKDRALMYFSNDYMPPEGEYLDLYKDNYKLHIWQESGQYHAQLTTLSGDLVSEVSDSDFYSFSDRMRDEFPSDVYRGIWDFTYSFNVHEGEPSSKTILGKPQDEWATHRMGKPAAIFPNKSSGSEGFSVVAPNEDGTYDVELWLNPDDVDMRFTVNSVEELKTYVGHIKNSREINMRKTIKSARGEVSDSTRQLVRDILDQVPALVKVPAKQQGIKKEPYSADHVCYFYTEEGPRKGSFVTVEFHVDPTDNYSEVYITTRASFAAAADGGEARQDEREVTLDNFTIEDLEDYALADVDRIDRAVTKGFEGAQKFDNKVASSRSQRAALFSSKHKQFVAQSKFGRSARQINSSLDLEKLLRDNGYNPDEEIEIAQEDSGFDDDDQVNEWLDGADIWLETSSGPLKDCLENFDPSTAEAALEQAAEIMKNKRYYWL